MIRNSGLRVLFGFVLLAGLVLSACSGIVPTDGTTTDEPVSGETPGVGEGQVYVDDVQLLILESFPVQVRAQIQGNLPDGCTEIEEIRVNREEESEAFEVEIVATRDPELMCTQALVPFEETVDLDVYGLPAGTYTVDVHSETATFELSVDNVPATE